MGDDARAWHLAVGQRREGPLDPETIADGLSSGRWPADAVVWTDGFDEWLPAKDVPIFQRAMAGKLSRAPRPPRPGGAAHDIDFSVHGAEMQYVEIELDPGETVVAEAGGMMYMDPGIEMETLFGDGSAEEEDSGFLGKALSAGKRVLTGESLFMTHFTARTAGKSRVAFAAPFPGRIIPLDLGQLGGRILCQRDAFLCAAKGAKIGIAFTRKLGTGFFGGEGFILQSIEGDGLAFAHASGTILERDLKAGETLRVDTGCLVAFQTGVTYDIQLVKGVKSLLFGGEGLFYATLTGPGRIWLQSLPLTRMARQIVGAAGVGSKKGETTLGGLGGGLGGLLGGD